MLKLPLSSHYPHLFPSISYPHFRPDISYVCYSVKTVQTDPFCLSFFNLMCCLWFYYNKQFDKLSLTLFAIEFLIRKWKLIKFVKSLFCVSFASMISPVEKNAIFAFRIVSIFFVVHVIFSYANHSLIRTNEIYPKKLYQLIQFCFVQNLMPLITYE